MHCTWREVLAVSLTATIVSMSFAAATMGYFRAHCNWMEIALLLGASFLLFRPDAVADMFNPGPTLLPAALLAVRSGLFNGSVFLAGAGGLWGDAPDSASRRVQQTPVAQRRRNVLAAV